MSADKRETYLLALDEELLRGGVILSEWCSFIVRETDTAFVGGGFLATILTAVSAAETYLRAEYSETGKERLVDLINQAELPSDLKAELHALRRYRNKWVHVEAPWNDDELLNAPEIIDAELERVAFMAVRVLRKTIYENPWV